MPRRSKTHPGNVFEIKLPGGGLAYGLTAKSPLAFFFDRRFVERPAIDEIVACPTAFAVWIMSSSLGPTAWPVIGHVDDHPLLSVRPIFRRFDLISGEFSLDRDGVSIPATKEECRGHEAAAVWSAVHIESRLADHFAGVPNEFVQRMDIDRCVVPPPRK